MVQLSTLTALAVAIVGVHSYGAKCPDNKCAEKAKPYCSSYLGVPKGKTVTATTTTTSTSIVTKYTSTKKVPGYPTTITSTITVPKTDKTTVTVTSSTETQSTVIVAPTCKASAVVPDVEVPELDPLAKRQNYGYGKPYGQPAKPTKPACMNSYKERADVTKACKCLSIKPSVTTVKKTATITATSTVKKCKEITTAPTVTSTTTIKKGKTTKTETTTTLKIKTLDPTTITTGDIAIPTKFNIISSNAQGDFGVGGPVAPNGLYAVVDPINEGGEVVDGQQPIDFLQPAADLATVFSLDDNNALSVGNLPGVFNTIAYFTTGEIVPGGNNDPLLITYGSDGDMGSGAEGDMGKPLSCQILPNEDGTCGLTCTGSGFEQEVPYVCGLDNTYYIGSGQDDEAADATCYPFSPLVVDAADAPVVIPDEGDLPTGDLPTGDAPTENAPTEDNPGRVVSKKIVQ